MAKENQKTEPIGIGHYIARMEAEVERGEAVKVWHGLSFSYQTTEKGWEVHRQKLEPYRLKRYAKVLELAKTDVRAAIRTRREHLLTGLFTLENQPAIPGVPLETKDLFVKQQKPRRQQTKSRSAVARIIT